MTDELLNRLYPRLQRKLGTSGLDTSLEEEEQLIGALDRAESELLLYLGVEKLEERFDQKLVELAALYYRRDTADQPDAKSVSVTEGALTQSVTYLSPEERQRQEQAIFASLARYRVVRL
jgi:hypothetical protein